MSRFQTFGSEMIAAHTDDPAGDADVYGVIRDWADTDALMRYMAVDRFVDNWDGIVAWYCVDGGDRQSAGAASTTTTSGTRTARSQRFHADPLGPGAHVPSTPAPSAPGTACRPGRRRRQPATCGPSSSTFPARAPSCDPFLHALATAGWDDYVATAREVLAMPAFQVEALHTQVDALAALIEDAVAEDRNGPHRIVWREAVRELKENIVSVREQALEALES